MSVTTLFQCLHADTLKQWINDRENFHEKDHPECDSIQLGVESMAVADLVARAKNKTINTPYEEFLNNLILGMVGTSVYDARIISTEDVARASGMMHEIRHTDLREVCNLDRLKADYREIPDWLWEDFGPNVLEDRLIPMFEKIRAFFHRAAERKQKVVVSWF